MRTIPFSLMNIHERFLLLQLVDRILKNKLDVLPELQDVYASINELRNHMEAALHKSRTNDYTASLSALDGVQDHGFLSFRNLIEAHVHSIIDTTLRPKAAAIELIIRRHGWSLHSYGIKRQLAVSLSLINELMQADNQQLLVDLGVLAAFNAWKSAVDEVESSLIKKSENQASKEDLASASEIGKQAVDLFDKLLPGWFYQGEFGNKPEYKELIEAIMDSAADLEQQARTRFTRNQKEVIEE